jgi:hypothetical protein
LEEDERIKAWKKRWMRVKAESDPARVAYRYYIPDEESFLVMAGKKEAKDRKWILEETPFDTWKAQIEMHYVYEKKGTPEEKVVDVIVECTNYGLTYSPEDIQAVNEGKKKIQQCKPIVKEYPLPIITIDEEAKKKYIALCNAKGSACFVVPPSIYELSGHTPKPPYVREKRARDFMKRPKTEGSPAQADTPPPPLPTVRTKPS